MDSPEQRPAPLEVLVQEAERQLTVCNACRYCEGYCAVFPALELRRDLKQDDIIYLANLCFECRACYYACPFTPPHEFGLNIPQALAAVRRETYAAYATPRLLSRLFGGSRFLLGLTVALCILLVFGSVLLIQGSDVVFAGGAAPGSFYRVVPYTAMVIPALALSAYWLVALAAGGVRFWRGAGGTPRRLLEPSSLLRATRDAFGLAYLKGSGDGCAYPDERPAHARRWLHQLLVGGILLDLASTSVAAVYHNFLGRDAPYAYTSWPVVLGTAGGLLIVLGALGLLRLKRRADPQPADAGMLALDYAFLVLLLLTSVSGLALLVLRDTAAQGTLLTVHLGIVAALYLTLPYGKFAHVVYRYAALVRYHIEQRRALSPELDEGSKGRPADP